MMSTDAKRWLSALFMDFVGPLVFMFMAGPTDAMTVTIVANPGPFGTIEAAAAAERKVDWWDKDPEDDAACTESFAATELRRFLAACAVTQESRIKLAYPSELPSSGHVVVIGSGSSNAFLNGLDKAGDDAFAPSAAESFRVLAFSRDDRIMTVIKGRDRIGTLYGVYAYLEKLGWRFFGLGEQGTVAPMGKVQLPDTLDFAESPHYQSRGFWAWENRGNPDFFAWMARNRLNFWTIAAGQDHHALKKLGMKLTAGHHNMQFECLNPKGDYPYNHPKFDGDNDRPADPYQVSPEYAGDADKDGRLSYFEAHPEWFCLRDGKRSDRINPEFGDNYCTSNNDATTELVRNLLNHCVAGQWKEADVINFWMLDGGKWCDCDACKRQGTFTDRLMIVIDQVLRAIKTARENGTLKRKVEIVTLAYHETLAPPSKPLPPNFDYANCTVTYFPIERCYVHPLADPQCTEINESLKKDYEGWTIGAGRHYTGSFFIGEYYNVSSFKSLPVVLTRIMAADIPWYYKTGARHFHYMHTPTRLWGTWTLNQYLMARLLWNVETDVNALLNDYFTRFYPTTTSLARGFYEKLELAMANIKPFKHYVKTIKGGYTLRHAMADSNKDKDMFPLDHLHYESWRPVLNDGPDMVEIMTAMNEARRGIEDALLACREPVECTRLLEDEQRFAYGEAMMRFYYHLARIALFRREGKSDLARREFAEAERQARILEGIVDLVQVSSSHANAKNGFDASQAASVYEVFKKDYGVSATAPAK